ncbi:hypothetical protein HDU81_000972, partial [Chytriomyces hyalinus]
ALSGLISHALAVTLATTTLLPNPCGVPAQSESTDLAAAAEPATCTTPLSPGASSCTLSPFSARTNASSPALIGTPHSGKSSPIGQIADPFTVKQASLSKLASPLSNKTAVPIAEECLPPKSAHPCSNASSLFSQTTPAGSSAAPSPKVIGTAAATSNPATPVEMTEAAASNDLVSQDAEASVPSPVPSLQEPTVVSPPSTVASPNIAPQPAPAQKPTESPADVPSCSSAADGLAGALKSTLSAVELFVSAYIASTVPLPPPNKKEEDFFASDPTNPLQFTTQAPLDHPAVVPVQAEAETVVDALGDVAVSDGEGGEAREVQVQREEHNDVDVDTGVIDIEGDDEFAQGLESTEQWVGDVLGAGVQETSFGDEGDLFAVDFGAVGTDDTPVVVVEDFFA